MNIISKDTPKIRRIAAFAMGDSGGNPAGVYIADRLPSDPEMQSIAAEVGYSETAFASKEGNHWRVRYFAPDCEVDFCGHATVALGMALADLCGEGTYPLRINTGEISVSGRKGADGQMQIELTSPPTKSGPVTAEVLAAALSLFGLTPGDLDPELAPAIANAGNDHLVLALNSRDRLAAMSYDLEAGRKFMEEQGLVTINLLYIEAPNRFVSRNAFAIGGVSEDPATGAAAAALAGYLRDQSWPHGGEIDIAQGDDMGAPSRLRVTISDKKGAPVTVSGQSRDIG